MVPGVISVSRYNPTDMTVGADDGEHLVPAQRAMSRPLEMNVISMPTTRGSSCSPELVGEAPWTVWR